MSQKLRPRPRALLHKPWSELGCIAETHIHEARASDGLQHVSLHREGNAGWNFNRDEALLQGE